MNTKKEYDLIFSIGEACSCTQYLREAGLQEASFPFDWLFGNDFIGRCDILKNELFNFIKKQDLSYAYSERSINCDAYHNKSNDLTFNHDFPAGIDIEKSYSIVAKKYQRRINRLLNKIQTSKKILIVYLELPTKNHIKVSDETIIAGYSKIIKKFGQDDKEIGLLYFENKTEQKQLCETVLVDGVRKITLNYKNKNPDALDYAIDSKKILKILSQYQLKKTLKEKIKKISLKLYIKFIPIKSIQKKMKAKYHVN